MWKNLFSTQWVVLMSVPFMCESQFMVHSEQVGRIQKKVSHTHKALLKRILRYFLFAELWNYFVHLFIDNYLPSRFPFWKLKKIIIQSVHFTDLFCSCIQEIVKTFMREWINIWSKFHAWDPRPHPSWKASESNANYISNLPPKYQRKLEECKTLRRIAKHHFSVCCFFIITINNPSNQLKKLTILKETFPCSVFYYFLFIYSRIRKFWHGWLVVVGELRRRRQLNPPSLPPQPPNPQL